MQEEGQQTQDWPVQKGAGQCAGRRCERRGQKTQDWPVQKGAGQCAGRPGDRDEARGGQRQTKVLTRATSNLRTVLRLRVDLI